MKCHICKKEMNEETNCGGDCLKCMAELIEDPDAIRDYKKYQQNKTGQNNIKSFEVPAREEIQENRIDEAVKKVEQQLKQEGKPFSERLYSEVQYGIDHIGTFNMRSRNIAKASNIPVRTILHWMEYGSKDISRLARLCKALDVDANYLLGLNDERKTLSEIEDITDTCPTCGCNELLCGHGGVGCTHEE